MTKVMKLSPSGFVVRTGVGGAFAPANTKEQVHYTHPQKFWIMRLQQNCRICVIQILALIL